MDPTSKATKKNSNKDGSPAKVKKNTNLTRNNSRSSASEEEYVRAFDETEHMSDWGFTGTFCNHCGLKNSEISGLLMQCGRCKNAYFCSTKCFNEALPEHQKTCQTGSWTRDPKGTKFSLTGPVLADVPNSHMGCSPPYQADDDGEDSPSRKNLIMKEKETKNSNACDDSDNDNVKTKNKSQLAKPLGKKKVTKRVYTDEDCSDSSATVETDDDDDGDRMIATGDDVTAAVALARRKNNVSGPNADGSDEEEESEYEDVYDVSTQTTVTVKKTKSIPTGTKRNSNKKPPLQKDRFVFSGTPVDGILEEDDDFHGKTQSGEIDHNGHVDNDQDGPLVDLQSDDDDDGDDDSSYESEYEEMYDVSTQTTVKVKIAKSDQNPNNRRLSGRSTGIRSQRKQKTNTIKNDVNVTSKKQWPTGRQLPAPTPIEKEQVRLRHREHGIEKEPIGWEKPDWVHQQRQRSELSQTNLFRSSRNSGLHDESFSAQVLLEVDDLEYLGNEKDDEEFAQAEVLERQQDQKTKRGRRASMSYIESTDITNSPIGRPRGRCHSTEDIDLETLEAWKAGSGLYIPSALTEQEKVRLRRIELQRKKEYGWEKPDWVTQHPIRQRLDSSNNDASFSILNLCSVDEEGNVDDDDDNYNNNRSNNTKFRGRSTKPEWVQKKAGLRSSGEFGRSFNSFSRNNNSNSIMNSSASNILLTKEELRRVADLQRNANRSYTWETPDWVRKSPLKKTQKGKALQQSGDLSKLSPKELVDSGKIVWKKPEWATRNPLQRSRTKDMNNNNSSNEFLYDNNDKTAPPKLHQIPHL